MAQVIKVILAVTLWLP